jgi:hypothetical protein
MPLRPLLFRVRGNIGGSYGDEEKEEEREN